MPTSAHKCDELILKLKVSTASENLSLIEAFFHGDQYLLACDVLAAQKSHATTKTATYTDWCCLRNQIFDLKEQHSKNYNEYA
ncbi:hypothetical protein [Methylomonas lenta]|uniref:hypothetical protein n=1 Tax=Methylomonas lenta TaxID=980561 RepID=UPI000AF2B37A|nr:hypothetical protein [Methylomonas lenta]